MKTIFKISILTAGIMLMAFNFTSKKNQDSWDIPEKYKKMKNPIDASNKELLMDGNILYSKQCKSCHGKTGIGDGPKADGLEGDMGDFSDSKFFKNQTDGELFYKIKFGRDDMPVFGKKLSSDEDIWLIINYIKTLSK